MRSTAAQSSPYCAADGPNADQQAQLQRLMDSLKHIEAQQKELQAAIKTAKADREAMFEKERDFFHPAAKEAPAPRMEVYCMFQSETL